MAEKLLMHVFNGAYINAKGTILCGKLLQDARVGQDVLIRGSDLVHRTRILGVSSFPCNDHNRLPAGTEAVLLFHGLKDKLTFGEKWELPFPIDIVTEHKEEPMTEQTMKERFELWYEERYIRWPDFGDAKVSELFEAFKAGVLQVLP